MLKTIEVPLCVRLIQDDPTQGWYWIKIPKEITKRFNLKDTGDIKKSSNLIRLPCSPKPKSNYYEIRCQGGEDGSTALFEQRIPRSQTRAAHHKYILDIPKLTTYFRVRKFVPIKRLVEWLITWTPEGSVVYKENTARRIDIHSNNKVTKTHYVYFIRNERGNIKIGRSSDPARRLKTLQTSNPETLEIVNTIKCSSYTNACELEQELHDRYSHARLSGEWFNISHSEFNN